MMMMMRVVRVAVREKEKRIGDCEFVLMPRCWLSVGRGSPVEAIMLISQPGVELGCRSKIHDATDS
jgi:hypothetical protein